MICPWHSGLAKREMIKIKGEVAMADGSNISQKSLDLISIGRSSVDLYGQQIGSTLEATSSFSKSVGGCPSNIAIGTARLGLKSAVITRVGDEAMGRFIRERMLAEGVSDRGIVTDPERLTSIVLLGVENSNSFPLIFYRENCADLALCEADIDPEFVGSAHAVLVTGTHFSRPATAEAQRKAMRLGKAYGAKLILDIDYRPNLWGLAGHGAGQERYIRSDKISAELQPLLPEFDLIVGTEEEVHIAGGSENTFEALRTIRSLSSATIVLKRGPMGCVIFPGAIPDALEDGIVGDGFPIEVYNVLGAGDAFMSGFLRGWLRGESLQTSATWANACGAIVVSRLLCSPEIPTWDELQYFLKNKSPHRALRKDQDLNHVHWATTRAAQSDVLMALAIDHRAQLEAIADKHSVSRDRIADFKVLAVEAAGRVAQGADGFGMLLDSTYGTEAFYKAAKQNLWIGRPVEEPGSRPLDFDHMPDLGSRLVEWPLNHTIKCLCFYHPDDPADLKAKQERELLRLYDAARNVGRELLIEIIAGKHGPLGDQTIASVLTRLYELGIKPDMWKLEPQASEAAWRAIENVIRANDPYCRGIVLLGLDAPEQELIAAFQAASSNSLVKGFAVGRTIFGDAAEKWFAGQLSDEAAIADMALRFGKLVQAWQSSAQTRAA